MESVEKLLAHICPSICVPGSYIFSLVLLQTKKVVTERGVSENICLSRDVYVPVADEIGKTKYAVTKAVGRTVDTIWMDGRNAALDEIIGRHFPQKPFPREIILYCAHYLIYGKPYHT